MEKKMQIEGMKCAHCKAGVEKALSAVPGVTGVNVNLEEKTAYIQLDESVSDQLLMDAVSAKGFMPLAIQ